MRYITTVTGRFQRH